MVKSKEESRRANVTAAQKTIQHHYARGELLAVGSLVRDATGKQGEGSVVDHRSKPLAAENAKEHTALTIAELAKKSLNDEFAEALYGSVRCPYRVRWNNGYEDWYARESLELIEIQQGTEQ